MRYFGTDGIRGRVGEYPINAEFVLKLGWAVGKIFSKQRNSRILIGKDTRISGYVFESALEAGLASAGVDVDLLGPMPTPAIAYLTRTLRCQAGIVISASHNSFDDNGIKFFSSDGFKLPLEMEKSIEAQLEQPMVTVDSACLGKVLRIKDATGRYIEFCKSSVPHYRDFKGLKIVIDCANGATYVVAPCVFRELGAEVIKTCAEPNGLNINENCGALHPELLQQRVLQEEADLGIAFDGDGDRVIMVDHEGEIVNGDELLYIIAKNNFDEHRLVGGVVGTEMSNLGLEIALNKLKIPFKRTSVGDRHVILALNNEKWQLGGESSGHIICLNVTTTGDGIIAALQVLMAMTKCSKSLHELKNEMVKMPQCMLNVRYNGDATFLNKDEHIQKAVSKIEKKLQGHGRVLLRLSGTEPLVRVMLEGEDECSLQLLAKELADVVTTAASCANQNEKH